MRQPLCLFQGSFLEKTGWHRGKANALSSHRAEVSASISGEQKKKKQKEKEEEKKSQTNQTKTQPKIPHPNKAGIQTHQQAADGAIPVSPSPRGVAVAPEGQRGWRRLRPPRSEGRKEGPAPSPLPALPCPPCPARRALLLLPGPPWCRHLCPRGPEPHGEALGVRGSEPALPVPSCWQTGTEGRRETDSSVVSSPPPG